MIFAFEGCVLDVDKQGLWRVGRSVHVEPQVLAVLTYLVEHGDRVVTKIELLDEVWGDRSRSIDDERATVAWTLANAGVANGQDVTVFAVSSGVDVLRKGAADRVQMNPHDPSMKKLIGKFMASGGTVWACPPCSALRNYTEDQYIDGVEITPAGPVVDLIKQGAATICL